MKNTTKQIWVNPVERISFQGRHRQVYEIKTENGLVPTVSKRKSRESNTAVEYSFPYNSNTGKLYTTLDKVIQNPLYELTPEEVSERYAIPETWNGILDKITKQPQIKKQTFLEIKHGVDPDYYTSNVNYVMTSLPSDIRSYSDKSFLSTLKVILYPRPNKFDDSTPRQELLMCIIESLAETGIIAKNESIVNSSLHDFYISQENELEQKQAKYKEQVEDATYNLVKLKREYGDYRTYQMSITIKDVNGDSIITGKPTKETINNALSDFVSHKDSTQLNRVEQFQESYTLMVEQPDLFDVKYLVQQACNYKVIGHRDNQYIWHSKAGSQDVYNLGTSFDKMVSFFYNEYVTHNTESDITNWYADLLEELRMKNIWIE